MSERLGSWGSDRRSLDQSIRSAAFLFLTEQTRLHGDVLPRDLLATGFRYGDERVPLLGPQGIFKPRLLEMPLSITTVPVVEGRGRPYADELGPDNLLTYRYRGTDPSPACRAVQQRQAPLVYFYGVVPGHYLTIWPVYVVSDDPGALSFTVAVDSREALTDRLADGASLAGEGRRQYVPADCAGSIRKALPTGAGGYRDAVTAVAPYRALERHILPDGHPKGEPIVPNGLALCKLHHAAFDSHMLGVQPDLVIELRHDILAEADGPMLQFGLQGFHGKSLHAPRLAELRPSKAFLAERFELFRKAG
jgi:putative restriction endonuclease